MGYPRLDQFVPRRIGDAAAAVAAMHPLSQQRMAALDVRVMSAEEASSEDDEQAEADAAAGAAAGAAPPPGSLAYAEHALRTAR